jgi:hypothetical protein
VPRRSARCRAGTRLPSPWPSGARGVWRGPEQRRHFFWTSTRASARSARCFHRVISRACSAMTLSRESVTRDAGPRFFAGPANCPRSRAARQVARWEEYRPSRRSSAPTAPGVLHPSASRTIFRLYPRVNRRRVALVTTSVSGPPRARSAVLIDLRPLLALDIKLPGGHCLTHIGTEGPRGDGGGALRGWSSSAPPVGARVAARPRRQGTAFRSYRPPTSGRSGHPTCSRGERRGGHVGSRTVPY